MTSISRSPMAGIRREMTLSSPMVADRSPKRKLLVPMDASRPSTPVKMLRTNKIGPPASNLDTRAQYLRFNNLEVHAACAALAPPDSAAPASTMADEKACSTSGDPRRDELEEEAATKVQKLFKGHRTRRSLADCAIVVEELWWKLCDSASLDRKSVSFFRPEEERETAASRWVRAGKRVARVGKGLSKDDKAQKLALRHWLEAIDPRHRYGHNLHLYYDIWFHSSSTEPFFYWLDIGAGRDIYHPNCPRSKLHSQLVMYLGMNERAAYEVAVQDGRLIYRQSGALVNTTEESKWIFVLSTTRSLYVGQKKKGEFQHSSFLAGGATSAAGRLVAKQGVLQAIWPYSGHYLPTEENFNEFITFLQENHVDLNNVKRCSVDDDVYPSLDKATASSSQEAEVEMPAEVPKRSLKWASGAGARIGCVREYPAELQSKALEQVNLSPKVASPASRQMMPIPSPRPSPRVRLSPRVQYMGMGMGMMPSPSVRPPKKQCLGIQAPTVRLTLPKHKAK